jgi:large subunit ribosomal protein L1
MNKKQKQAKELIDNKKFYSIDEAFDLLPKISTSKFPGTIEMNINFKLNDKQKKDGLRGSVVFPNSFGKSKKILVLCESAKVAEAEKAGADYAGLDELVKKIEKGWMDFDVVIATPAVMPMIAKLGKYIGKKGLMPNPKNKTITNDLETVIKIYKQGKKDFKLTEDGSIKIAIGKVDMSKDQIKQNFDAFASAIKNDIKRLGDGSIKAIIMSPTMGPSIKVSASELTK